MRWPLFQRLFEPRALVLMYHRIADVALDPWNLAVSPGNFDAQIKWLTSNYNVIPVSDLVQAIEQKKLRKNSICITFDDGYADNFLFAKPILEKYHCPATFFVPSHFIGAAQPFWWDELEALLLETPRLPQLFQLSMPDEDIELDLASDAELSPEAIEKQRAWRWPDPAPTARCALFLKLWEQLKPLPLAEIENFLGAIKTWAGYQPVVEEAALPMTHEQVAGLAQNNLFRIGLHTHTHPALSYHAEDFQYGELAENKKSLQPYNPLPVVAFPYGAYNNSTLAVLQRLQVATAFTTEPGRITARAGLHRLGRFQATNQSITHFKTTLQNWLSTI